MMGENHLTGRLYAFKGDTSVNFYIHLRDLESGNVAVLHANTAIENARVYLWNAEHANKAEKKLYALINTSEQYGEEQVSYSWLRLCPKPAHSLITTVFDYFRNNSISMSTKGLNNLLDDLRAIDHGGLHSDSYSLLKKLFKLDKDDSPSTPNTVINPQYDTWASW